MGLGGGVEEVGGSREGVRAWGGGGGGGGEWEGENCDCDERKLGDEEKEAGRGA